MIDESTENETEIDAPEPETETETAAEEAPEAVEPPKDVDLRSVTLSGPLHVNAFRVAAGDRVHVLQRGSALIVPADVASRIVAEASTRGVVVSSAPAE